MPAYPVQALAEQGVDDAAATSLRVRLAAASGISGGSKTVATVARSAAVRPSQTRQTGGRATVQQGDDDQAADR
jgi:hypothetical protein